MLNGAGRLPHQEDEIAPPSDQSYRSLVNGMTDFAIFMLDLTGRVVTVNTGVELIEGYRSEEILGKSFTMFYSEDEVAAGKPQELLETVAAEGRVEAEGWRTRKDGSLFWANLVITTVRDKAGNLIGFAKVVRDITGRAGGRNGDSRSRRADAIGP